MIRILLTLFLTFSLSSYSQTQSELNKSASGEFKKIDSELTETYQQILTEYKSDTIFINRLKEAQQTWIKYREAELEMKYPTDNKQVEYGNVYSMCVAIYLKQLTEERTEKLKIWLNGIEEGDICRGSVKKN